MFKLTDTQSELYELEQYSGSGVTWLTGDVFLTGKIDTKIALESIQEIVMQNEIFHLRIVTSNDKNEPEWEYVENIDLEKCTGIREFDESIACIEARDESNFESYNKAYLEWVNKEMENVPRMTEQLFKIWIVRRGNEIGMLLMMNHIISDGWTMSKIAEKFIKLYNAKLKNDTYDVTTNSYIEIMKEEQEYLKTNRFLKDKQFWENQIDKCSELTVLANHKMDQMKSRRVQLDLSKEHSKKIIEFCKKEKISEYVLYLSALGEVFHEQTNSDDFYIGSTLTNRTGRKRKDALGLLANTVPIYFSFKEEKQDKNVDNYIGSVKNFVGEVFRHQKHTYNRILKENNIGKIFDVSLNYQVASILDDVSSDLTFYNVPYQIESLVVHIFMTTDKQYKIMFDYQEEVFEDWEIKALQKHFMTFIDRVVDDWENFREKNARKVNLITKAEKELVLGIFNDTKCDIKGYTINGMFEEQVKKYPKKTAIIFGNEKITYEELNARANYVANKLNEKKIGVGDFVAISASKSVETVAAMLGTLKCGAAFVPIDPEYPQKRIDYILNDCKPEIFIETIGAETLEVEATVAETSKMKTMIDFCAKLHLGGKFNETNQCNTELDFISPHTKDDVAYMIYTSGTTGRPKGVLVEHSGVESLRMYFNKFRGIGVDDVVMQFASFSFDAAISEITMSILSGATMCIVTEQIRNDIDLLEKYLSDNHVTAGIFPPQYLMQLKNVPFKLLITAGSETNRKIIEKFGADKNCIYSNDYGPTEGTVCATAWKYEGGEIPRNIPIGKPIANKQVYVVKENNLCGIGVPGELCIAGEGLARGYHNQEELTKERFVDNPFGEGRLYKTGDRARWNEKGEIEFLGRIDNQVKIRGFRIEIAEIEEVMRQIDSVKSAAVVVKKNESTTEKYIDAYYTTDSDVRYEDVVSNMHEKLPNYMIPSHINQVTSIPLNRNGKVDVKELEKHIIKRIKKNSAPVNANEEIVLSVFKEVIGNEELGMEDNFFEEGGDSIKAIRIVAKLKEKNIFITVKNIIQSSTLREICKNIESVKDANTKSLEKEIKIEKRDKTIKYLPLTDIQKEIYIGAKLDSQGIAYNVPMIVKFKKELNEERANSAVNELLRTHASLRTAFITVDDELMQCYRDVEEYELKIDEYATIEDAFKKFLKPFDLENDLLFRMEIAKVDDAEYLMFDSHHIVVDGISMNILFDEFIKLYNREKLENTTIDFDDYIKWESDDESKTVKEKDLQYWEKVFEDGVEKNLIPADYERSGEISNEGKTVYKRIDGELFEKINSFCSKNKVTPFVLLMGAYSVLVYKLTSANELIIGVPTSGRFVESTSDMVGMFVSSLPFKVNVDSKEDFVSLVNGVGDNLFEILQHQNCTLNQIASRLDLKAENGQNPFFATMFGVNDIENAKNPDFELVDFEQNQAKFDITFDANRVDDNWELVLRYNKKLYKNEKMIQFLERYVKIVEQVMENPNIKVSDISILLEAEKNKLLFEYNDNKIDFERKDSNVVTLFHEQLEKNPNSVAVAFKGNYLTYRQLDDYSNILADQLVSKGIGRGIILPILTERSIEMLVMELAIIKTGAAFCPMDPAWPIERKNLICNRLDAKFILTGPGCYNALIKNMQVKLSDIKETMQKHLGEKNDSTSRRVYDGADIKGTDTFYVIYTSGSTGEPKGVVVPYNGIINRLMWMNQTLGMKACSSVLLTTNYVYDSSIWQFYWPLINGGKSVIPGPQDMLTADYLLEIIEKEKIGIVDFVPSVFNTIVEGMESMEDKSHALDSLVWVILGGEEIKPKAVNRFLTIFPHMKCINLYGPTEASIGCIYKALTGNKNTTIPIGKPISNVDILILDKDMNPVPEGICGEIYIGGVCLADGYKGDKKRTDLSFIPNPFKEIKSDRLYKTGDLAKWDENGDIFYLGRSDSQVKIRGFRIELQEIEAKILQYHKVKECIVLAVERSKDDKVLCAYIVGEASEAEIKDFLTAELPGYMVPSYYIKIDKIPISASGKANRKILPKPDFSVKKNKVIAPQNEIESRILSAWKKVLKEESISTDDNYFEIGGDSIKALQIVSILRRDNIEFTMPMLFANPTVMQLAKVVDVKDTKQNIKANASNNLNSSQNSDFNGKLKLSPIQKRYFKKYDANKHFNQAVMLENRKLWDKEILETVIQAVAKKHPMLRATFELKEDNTVVQTILPKEDFISEINVVDLVGTKDFKALDLNNAVNDENVIDPKIIDDLQRRLNPFEKTFECSLIGVGKDATKYRYLFVALNHLVIDAVSLRILIKEIISVYQMIEERENISKKNDGMSDEISNLLGVEHKSYKDFVMSLNDAKDKYHFTKYNDYWNQVDAKKAKLDSKSTLKSKMTDYYFENQKNVSFTLDSDITDSILTKANKAYDTKAEDLILTAFVKALKETKVDDSADIVVDMEAMGRNVTGNEADFAETVGWFTAIYPVSINSNFHNLNQQLVEVKEQLRAVPDKGVGYQLLSYDVECKNTKNCEISNETLYQDARYCFNYLGDLTLTENDKDIRLCEISNASMIHPKNKVPYAMSFTAFVKDNRLTVSVDYDKNTYEEIKIDEFKNKVEAVLEELSVKLVEQKNNIKTPSDFCRLKGNRFGMNQLQKIYEIAGKDIEKIYPLSPTQEGMLFHSIKDNGKGAYFEQNYLTIKGDISFENLKEAYKKVIENNDIFRTVFLYDNLESTYQVVKSAQAMDYIFEKEDISKEPKENQNHIIASYCKEDKQRGFDLQRGPLMRVKAFKTTENVWKLVWSDHHILMDGMCLAMLLDKFTAYYNALCEGAEIIDDKVFQYEDYIVWLEDQDISKAKEYWKNEVIDFEKTKELYKGGAKDDTTQNEYKQHLEKDVVNKLQRIASKNGVTLNALMQAAWAITLMRYKDTKDVIYGSVVSGRSVPIADVDKMIGLFISTLPIRIKAAKDAVFVDVAKQMMEKCANAEINSYCPLSEIQKFTEYGSTLFDHIFVFENFDFLNANNSDPKSAKADQNANREVSDLNKDLSNKNGFEIIETAANESTNYDLTVVVVPREEMRISFMYKKSIFTDDFMKQLMRHYINVINQVVENEEISIDEIEVLDKSDYEKINCKEAFEIGFPDESIVEMFNKQVSKYPERIAIQYENEKYTYREVDEFSNKIANTLLEKGIQQEDIIGILMPKSAVAIMVAIGILKAGGAYMPIDPSYPKERIDYMISDSNAKFVLIDKDNFGVEDTIDIQKDLSDNIGAVNVEVTADNLAYIIYTSGTTGKSKGTMITHRNVVRLFVNDKCLYDFNEKDVWVMFHSFSFDFSVWEMYGALLFGGKLIIITKDFARDTYKFVRLLESEKVTVLNQTPSAFNALSLQLEMEPSVELKVRYLIFGGEKLHPAVLKYFHERFSSCKIVNMYGITETTVHVTYKEITDYEIKENVSDIGVPIPTLGLTLVDSRLRPVPMGMQGEIVVWGHGVCRGYLNRPKLTAERFVESKNNIFNPYDKEKKEDSLRIYRSGDAGRYIENGLEYLGRIDQQVKIRGHRIELGEIKNCILKHSKIEDGVVIVHSDLDDNKSIVAYYQLKNGLNLEAHELREFVEEQLPAYMMPAHFIEIDKIPLNINGKVDKKSLPKPDMVAHNNTFEKPETDFEKYIAGIWEEVLNFAPIGLNDNYFEVGGDSIKVIKILSRVHADGYHFEVGDLFAHPTIKEFKNYVSRNENVYSQDEIFGKVKLTAIQEKIAMDDKAKTNQYNQMILLKSENRLDVVALQKSLKELVSHHDALRSVYVESVDANNVSAGKTDNITYEEDIRSYDKYLEIRKVSDISNIDFVNVVDITTQETISDSSGEKGTDIVRIEEICAKEQEKINLGSDKLYSVTLIKTKENDYIFFVIHHMVVDVVSWNVILEDFVNLYKASIEGKAIKLQDKTMSTKEYSEFLYSNELKEEVKQCYEVIWKEIASSRNSAQEKQIWNTTDYGSFKDTKEIEFDINGNIFDELRMKSLEITSANVEETLVAVTAKAVAKVSNKKQIAFAMESSGRFAKDKDIEVSRTVGWFTSIYPMNVSVKANPLEQICLVKESRRKIKDIEYTYNLVAKENTDIFVRPQISFNYLGRIDEVKGEFDIVNISNKSAIGNEISRDYAVDISCKVVGKENDMRLHYTIAYSDGIVDESWAQEVKAQIEETIKACTNAFEESLSLGQTRMITPSDFAIDLSMDELEYLNAIYGNKAIDYVKMTPMQKGMLYHVVSNPNDDAYYENFGMKISGDFSLEKIRTAFVLVGEKYPTLRTAFVNENISEPVQVILNKANLDIDIVDAREKSVAEIESMKYDFDKKAFVPEKGILSRVMLIQLEKDSYEIAWKFHHLILDGWSMSQILEEIFKTYIKLLEQEELDNIGLNELSTDVYRYIGKQNRYYAKEFWKNYLAGRNLNTKIAFEKLRIEESSNNKNETNENREFDFYVDKETTKELVKVAGKNVTLASIVISAWGLLLQMTTVEEEAVFGNVVSGRSMQLEGVNSAVGMFINTIPVCTSLQENETFVDSAKRLQGDLVNAERYSYYPLYEIQSDINKGNPIISHTVAFENYPVNEVLKEGLSSGNNNGFKVEDVALKEHTNYGIGAVFTPGERLKLNLTYKASVLRDEDCKKLGDAFCYLIKQIAYNPEIKIQDIKLLDEKSELELVKDYQVNQDTISLMDQFKNVVNKYPDSVAVKDEVYAFTYKELDEITNALAYNCVKEGIQTKDVVALMCKPSVSQALGIIGIMKSGAIYLPVDTSLPTERIKYMLKDSNAKRIVTDASLVDMVSEFDLPITIIDSKERKDSLGNVPDSGTLISRTDLADDKEDRLDKDGLNEGAYIIYTSGTTGKPKGVLVSKKNIAGAIAWRSKEYKLDTTDSILQLFSYAFDGFMTSFFTPIVSGAKVVFIENVLDVNKIGKIIETEKITHFISVPMLCQTIFENMTTEQLKSLRIITTAGDRLGEKTYQIIKEKNADVEIVNEYGPTECTVVSTIKRNVTLEDIVNSNIGKALDIGYTYIVDKYMHMLPAGLEGEIVVGGAGVSKGYLNAPELTNKSFVEDKWRNNGLIYRTGDKGKLLENGDISILGRMDKQVKLRGYRIETQEIETQIENMSLVDNAAVTVKEDKLVAYYVGTEIEENIRDFLSKRLPKYMVPNVFIKLDKLPQTRIGKIDYKQLPDLVHENKEVVMPQTAEEKTIWNIWQNVLGTSEFGITDNFFDIGGNSIRLMSVYGQLNKLYPDEFTVASLFSLTTVKDISEKISSDKSSTNNIEVEFDLDSPSEKERFEVKFSEDGYSDDELTEEDILSALDSDDIELDDLLSKL
ncbi:non-ribosomal peptide synthetase [Lachnobacterium bovis]|uniref:Non-ribosomal peptide synthase domain TIGR01720/amino acid adenylation domain-containing protein n=1 Tax=Lachnobacterium bovis DSM 14045 TaxID=1122142 RepID=A0A1H3KHP6_9FIRM|nr:non-ribosomal peptide synthetase [Lachnobacterium bovis]SDY51636.1 non-ribosomal peptide synthase domain TIGR01720/amino acid adenylation domain-containing protein [Lachnobacterium bovis DSM 14045]